MENKKSSKHPNHLKQSNLSHLEAIWKKTRGNTNRYRGNLPVVDHIPRSLPGKIPTAPNGLSWPRDSCRWTLVGRTTGEYKIDAYY